MAEIETLRLTANGLRFTARACGEGPLVLCLHGFPDTAHTYDALLPRLAAAGYRAVAPFMRGYPPTEARGGYDLPTLGRDVLGLADALGVHRFRVIGHDWGALAGYTAAAYGPERIQRLAALAVPPMRRFLLNMNPAQVRRSWYIGFFQLAGFAEGSVARDDRALIERLWRDWSPGWAFTPEDIAPVRRAFATREARRAALAYYRALPPLICSPRRRQQRRRILGRMAVPALVVAGREDGCIGPEMFVGSEDCFVNAARLEYFPTGHFIHREDPEGFTRLALEFLA